MNGVLVIDKPSGMTSHDVVARVRRALGESRIGHTGTLDPMATGVLPLVVGRATRLASLLSGTDKQYEAVVRLGCATDTYDATGRVPGDSLGRTAAELTIAAPDGIDAAAVDVALARFLGTYDQTPPGYSAKKIGGVAAYRLARRNQPVAPAPVPVTVSELAMRGYDDGLATLTVTASAGFYVRSLAHDIGQALGCGAHLAALRRTRAGQFRIADAVPVKAVEDEGRAAAGRLLPLEALLPDLPAVRLTERGVVKAGHGNALGPGDLEGPAAVAESGRVRLLEGSGALVGLAEQRPGGVLQPVVVLR